MANTFPLKPLSSLKTLNLFEPTPPAPTLVRQTIQVNGQPLHYFKPPNDDTTMGTLSCLQNNKFHLTEIPFADGDVIIDIGCNVGLIGLVVGKIVPGVRYFGFDASALAIQAARAGAAANGLTNYQAFNVAIGGKNEFNVKFFSNGKDASCLVEDGLNKDNKVQEIVINKARIDAIFDSILLGIDKVRYMKIDCEGTEFEIFDYLFEYRPDILDRIEFLHAEVHGYQEFLPTQLEDRLRARFGNRVFFDT